MAKVERPLFSDEATGRVGLVGSFKKGSVWDSLVPQFHRTQAPTPELQAQRDKYSAACKAWQLLSDGEKQYYKDSAPEGRTGFQYYLSLVL